jgi:hypothetical protein
MKTVLAILLMTCLGAAMAMFVGMHSAEIAEKHFDEVNKAFEEAGLS